MIPSQELNSEEMAILQEMIAQEKEMNPTQELVDIIEDMFCDQPEEELFSVVFDFFKVELRNALVKVQFDIAVNIIKGLRHLCTLSEKEKPWFQSKSNDVFLSISSPELLADLLQAWENCEIQQMEQMKQVLLLLPPEASLPLVFTLLDKSSPTIRNMLTDVIKHLLIEDKRFIEAQLTIAHESALENLVGILGEIEGETPVKLLIAITRYNSEKVRVKILKTLMSRKVWAPESLFRFIENEEFCCSLLLAQIFRNPEMHNGREASLELFEE